jgi:hypothetical protein
VLDDQYIYLPMKSASSEAAALNDNSLVDKIGTVQVDPPR